MIFNGANDYIIALLVIQCFSCLWADLSIFQAMLVASIAFLFYSI